MAVRIRDNFDFYNATADIVLGPFGNYGIWDAAANFSFSTSTRFAAGQSIVANGFQTDLLKKTGLSNQSTVFIACAFLDNNPGANNDELYFKLLDGATVQCSIAFKNEASSFSVNFYRGDRSVLLGTFANCGRPQQWYQFQFKVILSSTVGEFHVRMLGNTVDDFSLLGVNNISSGTAQTNGIFITENAVLYGNQNMQAFAHWDTVAGDQFNNWVGDLRAGVQWTNSDNSVQFSQQNGGSTTFGQTSSAGTQALGANQITFIPVTPNCGGTLGNLTLSLNSGFTGHLNAALYDGDGSFGAGQPTTGSQPGTLLAQCTQLTNPVMGSNTLTWVSAPPIRTGHKYWLAVWADAAYTTNSQAGGGSNWAYSLTYAGTFPSTVALLGASNGFHSHTLSATITVLNAGLVNDQAEDGLTTYVFSSTIGQKDLYGVSSLPSNINSVLGVDVVGMLEKSDAGARTAQIALKSGATEHDYTAIVPVTTFNYYKYQQDTDPNTSAQWTAANLNAVLLGHLVAS